MKPAIVHYAAMTLLAGVMAFHASAQPSLESLVSEASAEWMFGQWETQTENGGTMTLNVSWDLEKHVVQLHVKGLNIEAKGYTVVEANVETPRYYSFDNRGAVGKGSWNMEEGELVLRIESQSPERGPWKAAFIFGGSPTSGLQVRMHEVDSSGSLSTAARGTYRFKKK